MIKVKLEKLNGKKQYSNDVIQINFKTILYKIRIAKLTTSY